jgi:hypothetical protein
VCLSALGDDGRRRQIAAAGHARSVANGNFNERVMKTVVEKAFQP